jgi:hypothetical protein
MPLIRELVEESLAKHVEGLTRPFVPCSFGSLIPHGSKETLMGLTAYALKAIIAEVFKTPDGHASFDIFPSSSAHCGWSKKDKGALGKICSKTHALDKESRALVGWVHPAPSQGHPYEIFVPQYQQELLSLILPEALSETLNCNVHTVLEPMKARIISAGPPLRYHVCRMLQRVVHGTMRRRPEFSLIGESVTKELLERTNAFRPIRSRGWVWQSADYSAATDNIEGSLGELALEEIWPHLGVDDGDIKKIYLESMTSHLLDYDTAAVCRMVGDTQGVHLQTNGQLMGSPSSFPILCLINMAALHAAWMLWKEQTFRPCDPSLKPWLPIWRAPTYRDTVRDLSPLVNGDDLLFRAPKAFLPFWKRFVEAVGLKPSAGKNYTSEDFVVINSTLFMVSARDQTIDCWYNEREDKMMEGESGINYHFHLVPWVCSGLLKGQGRVLSDTRRPREKRKNDLNDKGSVKFDEQEIDLGSLASQLKVALWSGAREPTEGWRSRCQALWFRNCRTQLMEQDRSWRLPLLLGGLGLPFGAATRPQLVFANAIIRAQDWALAQKGRLKAKTDKLSVSVAMQRLKDKIAKSLGVVQLPQNLRPIRRTHDGRFVFSDEVEIVIPSSFVRWTPGDAESFSSLTDFPELVTRTCNWFKGGPADLEECLEYSYSMRMYQVGPGGSMDVFKDDSYIQAPQGGRLLSVQVREAFDNLRREAGMFAADEDVCLSSLESVRS